MRRRKGWSTCRRSCPPAFGLLLYFALARTPSLVLVRVHRDLLGNAYEIF
jgi:hypothetical protein